MHWYPPNPARNLDGAGFDWISEKTAGFQICRVRGEIRVQPQLTVQWINSWSNNKVTCSYTWTAIHLYCYSKCCSIKYVKEGSVLVAFAITIQQCPLSPFWDQRAIWSVRPAVQRQNAREKKNSTWSVYYCHASAHSAVSGIFDSTVTLNFDLFIPKSETLIN